MTQDSTLTPSQPMPPAVAQAAASAQLGALQRGYLPKRRNWALIVFNILIGLLMPGVLVWVWLLRVIVRTPKLPRSPAARRVYLFRQGFIAADRPGAPQG